MTEHVSEKCLGHAGRHPTPKVIKGSCSYSACYTVNYCSCFGYFPCPGDHQQSPEVLQFSISGRRNQCCRKWFIVREYFLHLWLQVANASIEFVMQIQNLQYVTPPLAWTMLRVVSPLMVVGDSPDPNPSSCFPSPLREAGEKKYNDCQANSVMSLFFRSEMSL